MKRIAQLSIACFVLLASGLVAAEDARVSQSYTPIQKSATGTDNATAVTLWTPPSGQHIALQSCFFSADLPTKFNIQSASVDVIPTVYLPSYGYYQVGSGTAVIWYGGKDATLTYTVTRLSATLGVKWSIDCWGYEENR